jgi:hypothetical protein
MQPIIGIRDPISSSNVLPPSNYGSTSGASDSQSSVASQLDSMTLMSSPNTITAGDVATASLGGIHSASATSASSSSETQTSSITAQAVTSGMDLQTCANQLRQTNTQYVTFDNAMNGMSEQVRQTKLRLDAIDILTHNIQVNQDNFESELTRLKDLYNTLAIRSNALGKWMADEKAVRDNLQELYREMVAKNNEESARLFLMSSNMRTAVSRLATIQNETSSILASVASAQAAMYDWAANVTVSANTHTTKLDSLQSALQYRITQIDQVIPEMRNMAIRTIYIARSLGETNLAYAAANVLSHIDSVLNSVNASQTILSTPLR